MNKIFQFMFGALIQFPVILVGLPLVALGLPFIRLDYNEEGRAIIRLPKWLLPWDNSVDGLLGDKRGYYSEYTKGWNKWVAMWWWVAIRNPANYFKRFILACDISKCKTSLLAGQEYVRDDLENYGWQLLEADSGKFKYYHFYLVKPWWGTRALVVQLGFKFSLGQEIEAFEYNYKKYKGFTFEVNPFKDIA
jgi:hypothetical protein